MERHRIFLPTPCQASPPFPRFLGTLTPASTYYGIRPRNLLHDSRLIIVHRTHIKEKSVKSFLAIHRSVFALLRIRGTLQGRGRRSLQAFQWCGYLAHNQSPVQKVHRYGQFALYQKFVRQGEFTWSFSDEVQVRSRLTCVARNRWGWHACHASHHDCLPKRVCTNLDLPLELWCLSVLAMPDKMTKNNKLEMYKLGVT